MNALLNTSVELPEPQPQSLSEYTDEELLLQYRETWDRDLFEELVRRYEHNLFSYLRRYIGNVEMAEDIFQATFLQVHLKCDQFEDGRRFRPWLYTIATNQAIDAKRRDRRHAMRSLERIGLSGELANGLNSSDFLVSSEPGPQSIAVDRERDEFMQSALDELSDQLRTTVELVYFKGLKYREAAKVMAIPVGTVKSRVHAAIAKLTELWARKQIDSD